MNRIRKSSGLIGIALFIVIVIVSGAALAASGNLQNPLAFLAQGQFGEEGGRGDGMGRGGGEGEFQPPLEGSNTRFAPRPTGRGDGESMEIQWSNLGAVLSNLWVIMAITAVIMLIGTPIGMLIKRFTRRNQPARTTPSTPPLPPTPPTQTPLTTP